MRGLNSESVDLIYLDPPFNSNATYSAPIGSKAAGASFKDSWTWEDVDHIYLALLRDRDDQAGPAIHGVIEAARLAHSSKMAAYLCMMSQRLEEMRRLLKPTGSIYLHCDPTASHYLKGVMDAIFGGGNFRNEIVWRRTAAKGNATKRFATNHDVILSFGGGGDVTHNPPYLPYSRTSQAKYSHVEEGTGRKYQLTSTVAPGGGGASAYEFLGVSRPYRYPEERMQELYEAGRIVQTRPGTVPRFKRYLDEGKGAPVDDIWTDIDVLNSQARERLGYPTQKPLALLERVIRASSSEGDVVFDPFCGCATTCVAAESLDRQWLGIDIADKAVELIRLRLQEATDKRSGPLFAGEIAHRTDQPERTDIGKLPHYRTHKELLYGEQSGNCGGCGEHFPRIENLTVDHIVAQIKGGTDHVSNLWLLCGHCNSTKGKKSQAEFLRDRMAKRGINPQWFDRHGPLWDVA